MGDSQPGELCISASNPFPCGEGRLAVGGADAGYWLGTGASNSARSMSYPTVELLGRVERRRRFSVEQKLAILTGDGARCKPVGGCAPSRVIAGPGLQVASVGRAWGDWLAGRLRVAIVRGGRDYQGCAAAAGAASRRQARNGQRHCASPAAQKGWLIEIELESGRRVRVDRDVDAAALERVLDVLARR